jgi:hypothetical protein
VNRCYDRGMKLLVRAIVTGFGLSIGAFVFKKITRHFHLDDEDKKSEAPSVQAQDGATDPVLRA